jgi:hypothetical protein
MLRSAPILCTEDSNRRSYASGTRARFRGRSNCSLALRGCEVSWDSTVWAPVCDRLGTADKGMGWDRFRIVLLTEEQMTSGKCKQ